MPSLILFVGPISGLLLYLILPVSVLDSGGELRPISHDVRCVMSVALWMAIWWISEAVPLAVTALLPVTVFPLLGLMTFKMAAAPYAHPLIFLFLGGFLLSIAIQKWDLHRQLAVTLLRRAGVEPSRIVGTFMLATAFLSMWLSNTATAIMMLPIALSVLSSLSADRNFARCLLLAIAYSASIGGMATIIGTPPNLYAASYFSEVMGQEIAFVQWMMVGVPCACVLLPITWWYLTRIHFRLPAELDGYVEIGGRGLSWSSSSHGAKGTLVVFGSVVGLWLARPVLAEISVLDFTPFATLTDASIALLGALALFVIPSNAAKRQFLLEWTDAQTVPWGTLILFGGGLSLAAAIATSGADSIIGLWIAHLPSVPPFVLVLTIVCIVIFLTELTSNTATTATLVPVLAAAAPLLGIDVETVVALVALAASCAFMLPVATPPNAIIFGSGKISARDMASAGVTVNVMSIIVVSTVGYVLVPRVIG